MTTHKGACFCGAVEIEVEGAPEAMGLPLQLLPFVVGRAGQCLHAVEESGREGDQGC
jgi:hypothetical protein